jgi:hypothetical protein
MVLLLATVSPLLAGPLPTGSSTVSVSYDSGGNPVLLTGVRNYNGTSPSDATSLNPAYNVKEFNSANGFGRRIAVAISYPEVIRPEETVIAHNFFKSDISQPFFPGIAADGMITFEVDAIQFNEPVYVEEDTVIFHTLWDLNQIREGLHHHPYTHAHNIHTLTSELRDMDKFEATNEINDHHDHMLGDMAGHIIITGEGTDTLHFMAEVPYEMFKHLAEEGQEVMEGFPAPHGFLEPFHFHFEYVVTTVPEPATLLLALPAAALLSARYRRRATS